MLVKSTDIFTNEATALLDKMDTLQESECRFSPYLVPVISNARFDEDLIKLESFMAFAEANGITDAGQAIASVCEVNKLNSAKIGFYTEESSLYASDDTLETAKQLQENGFHVAVAPIQSSSIFYTQLMEACELDEEAGCSNYDDAYFLRMYCEDYAFNENVFETAKDKITAAGSAVKNKVLKNYNNAKKTVGNGIDSVSKKLASISKAIKETRNKIAKSAGDVKAALVQRLSRLEAAYKSLKKKAGSMKDSAKKAIGNGVDKVKSAGQSAVNTVSGGFKAAKDKVFG